MIPGDKWPERAYLSGRRWGDRRRSRRLTWWGLLLTLAAAVIERLLG